MTDYTTRIPRDYTDADVRRAYLALDKAGKGFAHFASFTTAESAGAAVVWPDGHRTGEPLYTRVRMDRLEITADHNGPWTVLSEWDDRPVVDLSGVQFSTPPRNQGQMVTVSYGTDGEGHIFRRTSDASIPGPERYEMVEVGEDFPEDNFEPWNDAPEIDDDLWIDIRSL